MNPMMRLGAALMLALGLAACDPIVGGACAPSAIVCEGQCVDPMDDPSSCGGCGIRCADDEMCLAGSCVLDGADAGVPGGDAGDAGVGDASVGDGGSSDGGAGDVGPRDAGSSDAGPSDAGPSDAGDGGIIAPCDLGEVLCGNVCANPSRDPEHCGVCGNVCGATEVCQSGACVSSCEAPLVACGGGCVDLMNTPEHCGGCGNVCPTGLCSEGMCERALAGHVVLIGHDYVDSRNAMDRLLANAVLLSPAAPVRVLAYEGDASAASIAGVEDALERRVGAAMTMRTATDAGLVSAELASADVLLIHAQAGGTREELEALGVLWSRAMETFLLRGGVVVVLDTIAPHGGTFQLLEAAGRVAGDGLEDATLATARVVAPTDAVAIGVPLSYRAEATTVRFVGADLPVVVTDGSLPIVLHGTLTEPEP